MKETYTLKMFIEDYAGFDFESGTIVLVKKSTVTPFIVGNRLPTAYFIDKYGDAEVCNFTHDTAVIAITINA